jgi:hypothetical protein
MIAELSYQNEKAINPKPVILFMIIVILALGVVVGTHANKHPESATIRQCLDRNGAYMIFRSFDQERFYLICQVQPGNFGFQVVSRDGNEVTAFARLTGCWRDTLTYLSKFGTRFTGPLPWLGLR